jgi:hypothetical protein
MAAAEQAPAEEPSGPAGQPSGPVGQPTGPAVSGAAVSGAAVSGAAVSGAALSWAGDEAGLDNDVWAGDPESWPADEAAWPGGEPPWDTGREPPEPEDILLADDPDMGLPGPAECAAARSEDSGRVRVAEMFGAGFTHRAAPGCGPGFAVPSASGFAAGGPADLLEPGPVLAALTGQAWDGGLGRLGDDELIGVLCAARRVGSWQAALELTAVTELERRRAAAPPRDRIGAPPLPARTSEELAAALVLTGRAAEMLRDLAADLARLPAVLAALTRGEIDRARAVVFADELVGLGDADATRVAAQVLPGAGGLTTGQLRAALRRAVLAVDPAAGRRRRERAAAAARVELWAEGSGNWAVAGRELSPASSIAIDRHLTALARGLQAAGAEGTFDGLRSGVFEALLSGRAPTLPTPPPSSAGADQVPPGGTRSAARNGTTGPAAQEGISLGDPGVGPDPAGQDPAGQDPAGQDPAGQDPAGQDFAGQDFAGHGLASAAGTDPAAHGHPAGHGPAGHDPGAAAGRPGPGLAWPAGPLGSVHLTLPLAAWLGLSEGPGLIDGFGPADAGTCRDLADGLARQAGTRWCLTITSPDGQALGHACAPQPPPATGSPPATGPPGAGPPDTGSPPGAGPPGAGPPGLARWLTGLSVEWLETGPCQHTRQTPRYRPGARLAHLVRVRNPACSFPGCRRPARRCDLDHTVPYDQGGRTCECDLAPLCRQHHQTKQAPGWHLEQPRPGTLTWTAPHGRRYTTTPEPYPA